MAIAALVSARDNEVTEDLTSARLVRSSDVRRGKPRKSRTSRKGRNGGNRNIDKSKNKGKKEAKGKAKRNKSELSKKTSNKQIRSLTAYQEYKKASNQKKKANRVKGWFRMLAKKVNNSRTFFVEAAEFFKDCPEGLSVYQQLRYQNNDYNHETFY